jgi:hypothetical protein
MINLNEPSLHKHYSLKLGSFTVLFIKQEENSDINTELKEMYYTFFFRHFLILKFFKIISNRGIHVVLAVHGKDWNGSWLGSFNLIIWCLDHISHMVIVSITWARVSYFAEHNIIKLQKKNKKKH